MKACPQNMEQGAICLFHLYVNLWKCEGDISGKRVGPLFKLPVQTERAQLGAVCFYGSACCCRSIPGIHCQLYLVGVWYNY
jgi:hypothetical protein